MARFPTFPTTYNDRKSISITDLRKSGYLKPGQWKKGTITWSRNGDKTGSIGIFVRMDEKAPCISLSYILNKEKEIDYNIPLVSTPSNLGKGQVWYFRCPRTGKLCRKLYLIEGYFMHREAIKGYYEKQIQSKHYRYLEKTYGPMFKRDQLCEQLYGKCFRRFYNGRPTKRYLKIMAQLNRAEKVDRGSFWDAMIKR